MQHSHLFSQHCLAGWENTPSRNPMLSSLDLRASLEEKPHHPHLVRTAC